MKMVQSLILYASSHVITTQLCDSSNQSNIQLLSDSNENENNNNNNQDDKPQPLLIDLIPQSPQSQQRISSPSKVISPPSGMNIEDKIVKYYVKKLSESKTTDWGGALIQPSIKQTIDLHILIKCSSLLTLSPNIGENHFISVLRQIPWEYVVAIKSKDKIRSELIFPLKQIIDYASPKGFNSLLLLIGNILIVIAYLVPELSFECIIAISSGTFPMNIICISLLQFAPFQTFSEQQLDSIFATIYHIHHSPVDYIKTSEHDRYKHRVATIMNLIKFPILPMAPSNDPRHPSQPPKVQNLFHLFYLIANLSPANGYLQRLITQELFFYSFVLLTEANITSLSPFELNLIILIRNQANYYLQLLCSHYPQLLSTVIYCIAQNIFQCINVEKLLEFINPNLFYKWKIDIASIFHIRYFFARRKYPENISNNNNDLSPNQLGDLYQLPDVVFPPPIAEVASKIGTKLFSSLVYHKLSCSLRFQIAILFATSSTVIHSLWITEMLFGSVGNQLFTSPVDPNISFHLLQIDFLSILPQYQTEFILVQQLISLSLQEDLNYQSYLNQYNNNVNDNILLKTNFYHRFSFLISQGKVTVIAKLISKINREQNPKSLRSIFDQLFHSDHLSKFGYGSKNILIMLQAAVIESLLSNSHLDSKKEENYSEQSRDSRMNAWVDSLLPSSRNDKFYLTLLNDLIAFLYCTGDKLNYVISALSSMKFTMQDVLSLQQDGFLWVSLMVLFSYKPSSPSSLKNKDNAFYILQDISKYTSHSSISVAYWLHYFKLYFAMEIREEFVPKNVKENLNKYFISEAKYFETKDRVIYRVFYAFSTWKKDIIDASTGDFLQEQNIQLLKSLFLLLPAHFHYTINISQFDHPDHLPPTVYTPNQQTDEMTTKHLLQLLPPPLPPPPKALSSSVDLDQFITLDQALKNSFSYFDELNQSFNDQTPINDQLQVPIIQQIHLLIRSYNNLCKRLEELDNEFLEYTKHMNNNHHIPFQVLVACQRGRDCYKAAVISGMSIEIEQSAEFSNKIQQNRIIYDKEYRLFFDISRSIAQAIMLLKGTVDHLIHNSFSRSLILSIFYSILRECVFTPLLPPYSVISSDLLSTLLSMGKVNINDLPTQMQLLHFLLNIPSDFITPAPIRNNVDNIYNESKIDHQPIDLYSLFSPKILLEVSSLDYLKALFLIAKEKSKSQEEEIYLASCYSINDYIEIFTSTALSDEEADLVCSIITLLFGKSNQIFADIASRLITLLLTSGHQHRLFSIMFSDQIPANYCLTFISNVDYRSITLPVAISILSNLLNHLPVKAHHAIAIEKLIRNLTVNLPSFVDQFRKENIAPYDQSGHPVQSPLWNLLYQIYFSAVISHPIPSSSSSSPSSSYSSQNSLPRQPLYLEDDQNIINRYNSNNNNNNYEDDDENFAKIMELLYDIVCLAGSSLVDKVWYLFSKSFLQLFDKRKNAMNKSYPKSERIFDQFAATFPWQLCRFIYYDPQSLSIMSDCLLFAPSLIISIFRQLNLLHFIESLAQSNNQQLISQVSVQLLKLYFEINLVDKSAISHDLKTQLIEKSIEWSSIDPQIFSNTFNGNVFINIIKSGVLYSDPTQSIVDNALTLRSIAIQISHCLSMISLVREVRSLLFFYIDLGDHSFWYLPLSTHTSLITSCLVDPILYAPKYGMEQENIMEVKEKLLLIFSLLLNQNQWENSYHLPSFPFPNSSVPPYTLDHDDNNKAFNDKVRGLIVQFCSAVNRSLALKILHFIPLPRYSNFSEGYLLPHLWVEIIEVTLRNIFIYSPEINRSEKEGREILTNNLIELSANSIQISISDRLAMIETCKETGSSFTLLTLLYQWRFEFLQSSRSESDCWPIGLIESAINFTPNQYREFDIIPIWTFILTTISDPHFHPVQNQHDVPLPPLLFYLFYFIFIFKIIFIIIIVIIILKCFNNICLLIYKNSR